MSEAGASEWLAKRVRAMLLIMDDGNLIQVTECSVDDLKLQVVENPRRALEDFLKDVPLLEEASICHTRLAEHYGGKEPPA